MSEVYQFSIEDFHKGTDKAKGHIIRQYATNLLIVAATSINDGSKAEAIVNDAFIEIFEHPDQFHSQTAIKEFLYNRVNEECEKINAL